MFFEKLISFSCVVFDWRKNKMLFISENVFRLYVKNLYLPSEIHVNTQEKLVQNLASTIKIALLINNILY